MLSGGTEGASWINQLNLYRVASSYRAAIPYAVDRNNAELLLYQSRYLESPAERDVLKSVYQYRGSKA